MIATATTTLAVAQTYPGWPLTGSDDAIKDAIVIAVIEAWEQLDEEWLWRLTASMPRRVAAVLAAHGGYTQY